MWEIKIDKYSTYLSAQCILIGIYSTVLFIFCLILILGVSFNHIACQKNPNIGFACALDGEKPIRLDQFDNEPQKIELHGMGRIISENKRHPFLKLLNDSLDEIRLSPPIWGNKIEELGGALHEKLTYFIGHVDETYKPWQPVLGILHSHLLCMLDLIKSDKDFVLIFEDDVKLDANFTKAELTEMIRTYPATLQQYDPKWGVIFFGWCKVGPRRDRLIFKTLFRSKPGERVYCLHGYAISRLAAKQALLLMRGAYPIDNDFMWLNRQKSINSYVVFPMPFIQEWQRCRPIDKMGTREDLSMTWRQVRETHCGPDDNDHGRRKMLEAMNDFGESEWRSQLSLPNFDS